MDDERKYKWQEGLDDRQWSEVRFARLYKNEFEHGTDGHNRLLLIAKLSWLLDEAEIKNKDSHDELT